MLCTDLFSKMRFFASYSQCFHKHTHQNTLFDLCSINLVFVECISRRTFNCIDSILRWMLVFESSSKTSLSFKCTNKGVSFKQKSFYICSNGDVLKIGIRLRKEPKIKKNILKTQHKRVANKCQAKIHLQKFVRQTNPDALLLVARSALVSLCDTAKRFYILWMCAQSRQHASVLKRVVRRRNKCFDAKWYAAIRRVSDVYCRGAADERVSRQHLRLTRASRCRAAVLFGELHGA